MSYSYDHPEQMTDEEKEESYTTHTWGVPRKHFDAWADYRKIDKDKRELYWECWQTAWEYGKED